MSEAIQGFLLPKDKGLVLDSYEESIAEADILRQELGTLITELRTFIGQIRKDPWDSADIADALEEIIDG